tara:strand:+ start:321 stop:1589 length:1269 start_codon:yes stop_codon:yes gene_type:complete
MIKQHKNVLRFGRKEKKILSHLENPRLTMKERDWNSRLRLNCKSAEFTDIDGIDFFYAVFHHDLKNKDKLKDIITVINRDISNDDEKMITGDYLLKFTPILYSITKKMIQENSKEYRKFQRINSYLNRKDFKNWWTEAHQSPNENYGIGKVILDLRKFWAVFFSSFGTFKNFQEFERRILGRDKLSIHYSNYIKRLSDYGVPKHIDPHAISSTHHDNNLKTFTDFSVFSEIWRLNKPIFCTYRTLFIECTSGIKESDLCPFNNWKDFNFKKLSEKQLEDISEYIGDLVIGNNQKSIIGHINTGFDWADNEIERMFEEKNPTDRARLLRTAEKAGQSSYHAHGTEGSSDHTHAINPAHTSSRYDMAERIRAASSINTAHRRLYATEGVSHDDPDALMVDNRLQILGGKRHQKEERDALLNNTI